MRKFILLAAFLVVSPFLFIVSLAVVLLLSLHHKASDYTALRFIDNPPAVAYAALPTEENSFEHSIIASDARVESVKQFLEQYDSPLAPHAKLIVDTANKYGLDYRLIPAIAMQETNLCKKAREGSYNCWGFGVYGKKYLHFESYEAGIEAVTKTLATQYKSHGLVTPEQIMTKYTPSSNGSWADGVNHFMDRL